MTMADVDVIVIGGSAGSLEALIALVPALPGDLAIPIAVALHLAPDQPSLVPELLARVTALDVHEAEDKEPLRGATILIAPPGYHLMLAAGRTVTLSVDEPVNFSRPSIDVLFESAVDAFGGAVAGVILSGANDDGAAGLARIHAAGGVAVVQDPLTAPYGFMPDAALQRAGRGVPRLPARQLGGFLSRLAGATNHAKDLTP
jgi:two-component system chemotaxis response regulator CheB